MLTSYNWLVKNYKPYSGVLRLVGVSLLCAFSQAFAEESCSVTLDSAGTSKLNITKTVKVITGLGFSESKALVDVAPSLIQQYIKKADADAGQQQLIQVGGTASSTCYMNLQNRWKPSEVIHIEHGRIETAPIRPGAHSALWLLEPVDGTSFVRLKNRWKPDQYIHIENSFGHR